MKRYSVATMTTHEMAEDPRGQWVDAQEAAAAVLAERADVKRCKTCRHYENLGFASAPSFYCTNDKLHDHAHSMGADELAYAYSEGGYIHVGPEFGCVHHEPRDASGNP